MGEITLKVKAKINLSLGIRGISDSGYHDLDMLLSSVEDIYDVVRVYDSECINVTMDGKATENNNTAYRALELVRETYGVTMSADITKGVPFSAGLGGSSCDAAGVLCGFSNIHHVSIDELVPLADKVGSDVAFMMRGGAAISRGQGSDLTYVDIPSINVAIIKARGGSDTGAVFRAYDEMETRFTLDNAKLVDKIRQGKEYSEYMKNALYLPASGLNDEIRTIYERAKKVTDYVTMSGSGSSIVVVLHNEQERARIEEIACDAEYFLVTNTAMYGVEKM